MAAFNVAIVSCALFALALGAAAHGGTLHEWPQTPTGSQFIRTKVASCSTWVPVNSTTVKYSLTAPGAVSKPAVKGDAIVWNYLYGNCSLAADTPPSAAVEFNVTITRDGKPLSNTTLDGVAMTGSCAAGGGSPYYFDPDAMPLDDDENLLWFHNFTTAADGIVHGSGANDGHISTEGTQGVKSIMLVNAATNESLACCDLTVAGPLDTDWSAKLVGQGQACEEELHASDAAANGTDPHAGHDMHDHSKMDHSMHGDNVTDAAGAAGASARSSAGVASAGVSAVVGVAALLALALLA